MAQIRNGRLAGGRQPKGPAAVLYTVPAGFGAIVKFIGATPLASLAWDVTIGVVDASHSAVVWLILQNANASTTVIWNQWVALDAGDFIQGASTAVDFNFFIAGAELPYLSTIHAGTAADAGPVAAPPVFAAPTGGAVLYLPATPPA